MDRNTSYIKWMGDKMTNLERETLVNNTFYKMCECISNYEKRRTVPKQNEKLKEFYLKFKDMVINFKKISNDELEASDNLAIKVYEWFENNLSIPKDLRKDIMRVLIVCFNIEAESAT